MSASPGLTIPPWAAGSIPQPPKGSFKTLHAFAASSSCLHTALTGGENSGWAHTSWFKQLIWLCLKFTGITVNQRVHIWEIEKFFVPLNYMNPKRSLASKGHINPSDFVIVIRDLFLLSVA